MSRNNVFWSYENAKDFCEFSFYMTLKFGELVQNHKTLVFFYGLHRVCHTYRSPNEENKEKIQGDPQIRQELEE